MHSESTMHTNEKRKNMCPDLWRQLIDDNEYEPFSQIPFEKANFFATLDAVLYMVRRSSTNVRFLKTCLESSGSGTKVMSYREYYVFREAFRYQAGLETIEYLWRNYYIPLTCMYQSPLINACAQGNRSLICFLLEKSQSIDWKVKNFKAVRSLVYHKHFDLLFELVSQGEIKASDLAVERNFALKFICSSGDLQNMKRMSELFGNDFDRAVISDSASCIERTIKSGCVDAVEWLVQRFDASFIGRLFSQENYIYLKIAAQTGNVEMFKLVAGYVGTPNVFFLINLCKYLVTQGHLDVFRFVLSHYTVTFKFESYMVEFFRTKIDEGKLIAILEYIDESGEGISQESFTELFYSALSCNKLDLTKFCLSKLSEYNKQYLVDETILQHMHSKLTNPVRNWVLDQFPDTKEYLDQNVHFCFTNLLVQNELQQAMELYRPGFVDRFNISFFIETACINSNYDMFEWLMGIEQPSSFLYFESFGKVCESGNMQLLKMITQYTLLTEIQQGFVTACMHGHIEIMDYLLDKFKASLDVYAAFDEMIAKQLQIENMDVFYWFSEHCDFKRIMDRMACTPRKFLKLFEGVCSGGSYELFRWLIRFIIPNKVLFLHVVKWAAVNNRENVLLYVMDIHRLYDIDAEYILKLCLAHGNLFVLGTSFYTQGRFGSSLIKSIINDVISDHHAFQIIFRDYLQYAPAQYELLNWFDESIDRGYYQNAMLIFSQLGPFEQYKAIKDAVKHTFLAYGNDAFFSLLLEDYPSFAPVLRYDPQSLSYNFHDNLKNLLTEGGYDQVSDLLGINLLAQFTEEENCYICLEEPATIKSHCGHFYCLPCLIEYVLHYECTSCVMCRQTLDLGRLKNKK